MQPPPAASHLTHAAAASSIPPHTTTHQPHTHTHTHTPCPLKQESEYVEYYYRALKRWEHYVPIMVSSADDVLTLGSHNARTSQCVHSALKCH